MEIGSTVERPFKPGLGHEVVTVPRVLVQTSSLPGRREGGPVSVDLSAGDDPTVLFMHIAKTGGTSIRSMLERAYQKDERAFIYDPADLRGAIDRRRFGELPKVRQARLRFVMGHFQYGLHSSLGRPFTYVAIVRDPVDRVVSLYYHYLHLPGLRRYLHLRSFRQAGRAREEQAKIRRSRMSLEEWVFGQQRLSVDNGMVRNIAARRQVRFGQCPDDLLDEAVDHVDRHFSALLVTSELSRSLPILESITGRRLEELGRRNVNKKRALLDELDPHVLERIRDLNRLDTQLYALACSRLATLL